MASMSTPFPCGRHLPRKARTALLWSPTPCRRSEASIDRFELVGREIKLVDGRLTTQEGTLAGAHLDMASAVRNAVELAKVPLEDALRAASLTPAQFLGVENERGAIVPGARADLVAIDRQANGRRYLDRGRDRVLRRAVASTVDTPGVRRTKLSHPSSPMHRDPAVLPRRHRPIRATKDCR